MPRTCVYIDDRGRRCKKPGEGQPALCARHWSIVHDEPLSPIDTPIVEAAFHRVMETPAFHQVVGSVSGLADRLGHYVDRVVSKDPAVQQAAFDEGLAFITALRDRARAAQPPRRAAEGTPPPRSAPPPPPRRPPPPDPLAEARRVLGFAPGAPLTKDDVKDRQRSLAKRHHPDRGGNPEIMKRINIAADAILKTL
jgi:hypothetical protein